MGARFVGVTGLPRAGSTLLCHAPLISLHAVPDLPKAAQERLYFLRFED